MILFEELYEIDDARQLRMILPSAPALSRSSLGLWQLLCSRCQVCGGWPVLSAPSRWHEAANLVGAWSGHGWQEAFKVGWFHNVPHKCHVSATIRAVPWFCVEHMLLEKLDIGSPSWCILFLLFWKDLIRINEQTSDFCEGAIPSQLSAGHSETLCYKNNRIHWLNQGTC